MKIDPYSLADVVGALVPLTGLAELRMGSVGRAVVPAALGLLKGLRSLTLRFMRPCVLTVGCLELPNLESLVFDHCDCEDAKVLPGVTALQCLTRIEFQTFSTMDFCHRLVQLAAAAHCMSTDMPYDVYKVHKQSHRGCQAAS